MKEEEILGILPLHIRTIIKQAGINWDELQEIRLRIQKPVILKYNAKTCYLSEQGKITTRKEQLHIVTSQEIRQAMEYISSYSMYAYIEQLKQGFLTIRGGHRVGICGTVVMDHDKVKTIRHISGLNIRVAHEVKGCADILYSRCTRMGKLIPTLIISPPGCGKTTLLRDMIRKISDEGHLAGGHGADPAAVEGPGAGTDAHRHRPVYHRQRRLLPAAGSVGGPGSHPAAGKAGEAGAHHGRHPWKIRPGFHLLRPAGRGAGRLGRLTHSAAQGQGHPQGSQPPPSGPFP